MPINNRTSISVKIFMTLCLVFGLFLCEALKSIGYSYVDELIALSLASYLFLSMLRQQYFDANFLKAFYVFAGIFFFYYVYSWLLSINPDAINMSFVVHVKPFLTFFSVYMIGFTLDDSFKKYLSKLILLLSIGCLAIALTDRMFLFYRHPAYFAMTVSCLALFYYYTSRDSLTNSIISIGIMAIALLSFRMKAVGFFILFVIVVIFYTEKVKFRFSLKNILLLLSALLVIFYYAKDKIYFYFINPYNEENLESAGRASMYITSLNVLNDYLPLGPGFGTYADIGAATYYSPLYYKYQLDTVFGLSPIQGMYLCDTFFPDLAQFGVVGIALFFYFWYWIFVLLKRNYQKNGNLKLFKIGLLIIGFLMIESIAATTFVQSQGLMVMFLLALVLYEGKSKNKEYESFRLY